MTTPVVQANIDVHTRMASSYEQEPHFRPENQAKVRKNLEALRARVGGKKLLDMGCGTGFILRLAHDLFEEVHGVDVTPAMLERVDLAPGNIRLHTGMVEALPFADNTFDMVTAYSFLHHLEDANKAFAEAYRVLVPGGLMYVDLEPNKLFWDAMTALDGRPREAFHPWLVRAIDSVVATDAQVEKDFGIPQETFRLAEYTKAMLGGFDPRTVAAEVKALGFSACEVQLEWYVGQAAIMHGQSQEEAERVEGYLRNMAPLSDQLFKYVRLVLVK